MTTFSALLLVLFLIGGLVLTGFGSRQAKRARSAAGVLPLVISGALIGAAFTCFALFGAGFWHFGGREGGPDDGNPYICSAWWAEVGSRSGSAHDVIRAAPYCHDKAVDAIVPTATVSIGIGLVASGATVALLWNRRRKFDAALHSFAAGS